MIAIVDYGVGNLFSLGSSFDYLGVKTVVTGDKSVIEKADKIILPGVGAFGDASKRLKAGGFDQILREQAQKNKPIMGICLGMQLLFEKGKEYGDFEGLGLIKGSVVSMQDYVQGLKIPQIGWNAVHFKEGNPIFRYIKNGDFVYFVHSYYAPFDTPSMAASTEYGIEFASAVAEGNVYGCQFHPEKSGKVGLDILRGFCDL